MRPIITACYTLHVLSASCCLDTDACYPRYLDSQVDFVPLFSKQSHVVKPAYDSLQAVEENLGPVSAIFNTVEYTDQYVSRLFYKERTEDLY